jgi:prevent-host-death family protein
MDIVDIGAFEAKTRLSELLEQVGRGRVYRITKRGKPIAELRPIAADASRRVFGEDRGRVKMAKDFETALADFKDYK